ncbi:hypothetical protein PRIPAC_74490 [Pristionchus pacificus]|uniref:Uncharacterized protein n=1 Tax=Pristionchus pacificus TaxID=54126 RepID=A0A2A6BEM3_PRIPA|nr:hypothetical protein PRIPAC_74490 [Pristionchus pacificus]|eukprot:PDM64327.1 hypothetical protein PRIPAC_52583 [Pristionchus pacificus]
MATRFNGNQGREDYVFPQENDGANNAYFARALSVLLSPSFARAVALLISGPPNPRLYSSQILPSMCKRRPLQMGGIRQRRKMEERREIIRQKSGKESALKSLFNPRGGRHAVIVLGMLIVVVYYFNFHNPHLFKWRIDEGAKIKDQKWEDTSNTNWNKYKNVRETQLEVMRQLTTTQSHILHQFCDSFGECFNVENRYWNVEGRIIAQRMISIRARSNLVLTMAQLTTPQVLTTAYLDPMRWEIDKTILSLSLSDRSRPQRLLQIGMGGGATTNFLALMPVNLSIDVVELEPTVYDVAKRFFGLSEDNKVRVNIEDGVKFVERAVNAVYDSILLDACTNDVKEAILCPTTVFRDPAILGNSGVLSVNMFTTRDRDVEQYQIEMLYQKFFIKCFSLRFNLEQKMLFCSNRKDFAWHGKKNEILMRLEDFDYRMRTNLAKIIATLNN